MTEGNTGNWWTGPVHAYNGLNGVRHTVTANGLILANS